MKDSYRCPYCDERSTRRWNLEVHIKRKHGGSPGPYLASHPTRPFSYKPTNPHHNIESITADNGGNSFQPRYGLQQTPLGTSQDFASPMHPPRQIMNDQSYGTGLSETTTTKLKIEELKRLVYKYHRYQNNDPLLCFPLYSTSTSGLSEPAILIELSSPFSLLCLAPIEAFLSIIPASSNSCISLPFFIIFGLPSIFILSSIFKTARDSGLGLLIE